MKKVGSVLSERTYGRVWDLTKRYFKAHIRPRYMWRTLKHGISGSILGGLVGGGIGAFVGAKLGQVSALKRNWNEERAREIETAQHEFSEREKASPSLIEKAKKEGVVQKVGNSWRIVAIKKGELWNAHYDSREKAEKALAAYHANRHH